MDLNIKIKPFDKEKPFKLPTQAYDGAAGWDLYSSWYEFDNERRQIIYHLNISVEFPVGYGMILLPRSSIYKKNLRLTNSVGLIDSDYRGEIMARFDINEVMPDLYSNNEAIIQCLIVELPKIKWELNEELSNTRRGEGGFGSSDSKQV